VKLLIWWQLPAARAILTFNKIKLLFLKHLNRAAQALFFYPDAEQSLGFK